VHEDPFLLVLDKPAGLLCVPGRGEDKQDCLSARAMRRWPDALIVHRLDMGTSGLVVMARGTEMQRALERGLCRAAGAQALRSHRRRHDAGARRLVLDRCAAGGRLAAPPAAEGRPGGQAEPHAVEGRCFVVSGRARQRMCCSSH
jgi:hypothetical protein